VVDKKVCDSPFVCDYQTKTNESDEGLRQQEKKMSETMSRPNVMKFGETSFVDSLSY
jgi:hypothetical protein